MPFFFVDSLNVTDENRSAYDFCFGKYLCDDGSCRVSPFACPELQCPFSIPYRCTNGLCVHYSWECPEAIGTVSTNSSEIQCNDQSVVSNSEDCPLSYYCPAPYHRCQNGLCVLSLSLCPLTVTSLSVSLTLNLDHPSL